MDTKAHYIPEYKTIKLENGLKIFWHERPTTNTVGIKAFIRIGGANESLEGSSHFIEHLVSRKIEDALESLKIDGTVSATTSRVYTKYSLTIAPQDLKKSLSILQNVLFNLEITKEEFDAEKNRVLNEIAEYEDDIKYIVEDELSEIITKESNSAFRDVAGRPEKVSDITLETLIENYKNSYKSGNIILAISAPLNISSSIKKDIDNIFNTEGVDSSAVLEVRKTTFLEGRISHLSRDSSNQIYVRLGFSIEGDFTYEEWLIADIMNFFIGQLLKPILDRGLAYSITNNFVPAREHAYVYIDAIFGNEEDLKEGITIIKEKLTIDDPQKNLKDKFDIAKNNAIRGILVDFESDYTTLNDIGWYDATYGGEINFKELLEKTESVTFEETLEKARKVFDLKNASIVTLSSPENTKAVKEIVAKAFPAL